MTNSEAIELIKGILPQKVSYANLIGASSCYGDKYVYESPEPYALELAISALEENTKLKAEIEQLNGIISRDMDKHECYVISKSIEVNNLKIEIEQLKEELEQAVKLPCKCENCKYADFMGVRSENFYCMEHHRYMVIGGYCSFGKSEVENGN